MVLTNNTAWCYNMSGQLSEFVFFGVRTSVGALIILECFMGDIMRRISCIIMTVIIVFSLVCVSSCSAGEKVTLTKDEEKVTLTKDNFNDYFILNSYVEDYQTGESLFTYDASCNWTIEIIPISKLEVEELAIKLKVNSSSWKSDDIIQEDDGCYVTLKIPTNGSVKKVISCSYSSLFSIYPSKPACTIAEVNGVIII